MTTTLYRAFDSAGQLLYVGISDGEFLRLGQHERSAPWAVHTAVITLKRYPSRVLAERFEAEAIASEDPVFNVRGRATSRYLQWMAAYPHHDPDDVAVSELLDRVRRHEARWSEGAGGPG